jgi:hypothetical protein
MTIFNQCNYRVFNRLFPATLKKETVLATLVPVIEQANFTSTQQLAKIQTSHADRGVLWHSSRHMAGLVKSVAKNRPIDFLCASLLAAGQEHPVRQSVFSPNGSAAGLIFSEEVDRRIAAIYPRDVGSGQCFSADDPANSIWSQARVELAREQLLQSIRVKGGDLIPRNKMYMSMPQINECHLRNIDRSCIAAIAITVPRKVKGDLIKALSSEYGGCGDQIAAYNLFAITDQISAVFDVLCAQYILYAYTKETLPVLTYNKAEFSGLDNVSVEDVAYLLDVFDEITTKPSFIQIMQNPSNCHFKQGEKLLSSAKRLARIDSVIYPWSPTIFPYVMAQLK